MYQIINLARLTQIMTNKKTLFNQSDQFIKY